MIKETRFSKSDKAVIRAFAAGDDSKREAAIGIFFASLRTHGVDHNDAYFEFMSESTSPCPCWIQKSKSRAAIIGTPWP